MKYSKTVPKKCNFNTQNSKQKLSIGSIRRRMGITALLLSAAAVNPIRANLSPQPPVYP